MYSQPCEVKLADISFFPSHLLQVFDLLVELGVTRGGLGAAGRAGLRLGLRLGFWELWLGFLEEQNTRV